MHFEKANAVHKTLEKVTKRLDELGIPYAVVGAMAFFFHGYRRFTDDVDLLVSLLNCTHVRLPNVGHLIHQTQTETAVRLMTAFLESLREDD